jgi:hypothetical protein
MSERDDFDEKECPTCALLVSDCVCNKVSTREEREFARAMRLTRSELGSLVLERRTAR